MRSRSVAESRLNPLVLPSREIRVEPRPSLPQVSSEGQDKANLGMASEEEIMVVSDRDAVRPLAPLRRAIFNLAMITPGKAFTPRWHIIKEDWHHRLNSLNSKPQQVTEEDFTKVPHHAAVLNQVGCDGPLVP